MNQEENPGSIVKSTKTSEIRIITFRIQNNMINMFKNLKGETWKHEQQT